MSGESSSLDSAAVAKKGTPGGLDLSPDVRPQPTGEDHLSFWMKELEEPSFVYIVRAAGDAAIKIGRALDVRKRLATLQTGNSRVLQLLYVLPGDGELEWQLHYRMRESRVIGEWFAGPELPAFLIFIHELAEFFVSEREKSGETPDFRRFGDSWAVRRQGESPITVRFSHTDPDPAAVERANELRRLESQPREFKASERQKREFAAVHSGPTFTPHKSR